MKMDGWQDRLHISFLGEHFLFGALRIESLSTFILASFLTMCFCFSERMLTLAISKHWNPLRLRSRLHVALWRAGLYWFVTFDRLLYMLVAMTFHLGIIIVTVTTLSAGQFIIEYIDTPCPSVRSSLKRPYLPYTSRDRADNTKEPLLHSPRLEDDDFSYPMDQAVSNTNSHSAPAAPGHSQQVHKASKSSSKSKPEAIFIHPAESNILRAEALDVSSFPRSVAGSSE